MKTYAQTKPCSPAQNQMVRQLPTRYTRTPCSRKKEWCPNMRYAWTGPDHTVLSETPDTQGHTVCDPIFVKCPQQANPQRVGLWVSGWTGGVESPGSLFREENVPATEKAWYIHHGGCTKTPWTIPWIVWVFWILSPPTPFLAGAAFSDPLIGEYTFLTPS